MSNFTKSIIYSGVVLVAGLVAIFTIYNNMTSTPGINYGQIEPAAGTMDVDAQPATNYEGEGNENIDVIENDESNPFTEGALDNEAETEYQTEAGINPPEGM